MKSLILYLGISLMPLALFSQSYQLSGIVKNALGAPLSGVNVEVVEQTTPIIQTDESGTFSFENLKKGTYQLKFSHVGFKPILRTYKLDQNRETEIVFREQEVNIDEVYVTARESRNISTSSIINKEAMQHLQPSSFGDLLELLPGGRAVRPVLNTPTAINLRGPQNQNSDYQTHAMGTQFNIDGMLLNSSSSMTGASERGDLNMSLRGIDMRGIGTDNISKVEIIRGIPSVEYGNLTSGVILIDRDKGYQPWSLRIKADGFSKLISAGKGFDFKNYKFNIDGGFLYANPEPTNIFTSYKRLNSSVRGEKTWKLNNYHLTWGHQIDVNGTIDNFRFDPDNDYQLTDNYKQNRLNINLGNKISIFSASPNHAFKNATLSGNIQFNENTLSIDKLTQIKTPQILLNSVNAGSYEAYFLTSTYVSEYSMDDKPLDAQLKLVTNWHVNLGVLNQIKAGIEYNYSKNYGEGVTNDLNFPINTTSFERPRAFRSIPAWNNLALYIEDRFFIPLGKVLFENSLGIRMSTLTNLSEQYTIAGKILMDPRWNGRFHLPKWQIGTSDLKTSIGAGYGIQQLAPNLQQMYPNLAYRDIAELAYYHNNPEFRLGWGKTMIFDPTNFNLQSAKNKKWELSTFLEYNGNSLSITYFQEHMSNGFRKTSEFEAVDYKKYIVESVDPNTLTSKPDISDFEFKEQREFKSYSKFSNGTLSDKKGIEYQFSSKRIRGINTRFTVNGAWFKVINKNSQQLARVISPTVVTDNKVSQYVGIYDDLDGQMNSVFNTNLMADSYLPKLGLNLSLSIQQVWYKSNQSLYRNSLPTGYYSIDGQYHVYLPSDAEDVNLRHLDLKLDETNFRQYTEPTDLQINLKATKVIKDKIRVAVFVNQLFVYRPTYTEYGIVKYRQNKQVPYFGMEINIKI